MTKHNNHRVTFGPGVRRRQRRLRLRRRRRPAAAAAAAPQRGAGRAYVPPYVRSDKP